jgi:hypothetical protein
MAGAARAGAPRGEGSGAGLGRGGAARRCRRLRRAGTARRARLSHARVPVGKIQPAHGRIWRIGIEPDAVHHRGDGSGADALAGAQAAVRPPLGGGQCRLGTGAERATGKDPQTEGRRRDRLLLRRHHRRGADPGQGNQIQLSGAAVGICEAPCRHHDHGGRPDHPRRSGRADPARRAGRSDRGRPRDSQQSELADGRGAETGRRGPVPQRAAAVGSAPATSAVSGPSRRPGRTACAIPARYPDGSFGVGRRFRPRRRIFPGARKRAA